MKAILIVIVTGLLGPGAAAGQTAAGASGVSGLEAGYGGSRRVVSRPFNPNTRDANGNRLVLDGVIVNGQDNSTVTYSNAQSGRPAGAAYLQSGAGSATGATGSTAIGNLVTVSITGHGNTVVLNAAQTNTGTVSASGTRR